MSCPVFLITSRTLFSLANLMPAATSSALVALMVYAGEVPSSHNGYAATEALIGGHVSTSG